MMPSKTIETPGNQQTIVDRHTLFNGDRISRLLTRVKSIGWFMPTVVLVLLLAFVFRLPTLSERSVWMDEAYSYWFSNLSWTALWTQTPFYETHPPFYYSLLKIWTWAAGSSEAGMRSLSVAASLATVAVTAFAPRLLGFGNRYDRIGLVAAFLLAINQGSIEYAQQARPYAMQTLFATLMIVASAALLKRLLIDARDSAESSSLKLAYLPAGIYAGVTLWLHNTSPSIIFGNWIGMFGAVLLFSTNRRRDLIVSIKALLVALLIWAPCIPIAFIESKTVAGSFWASISPKMLTWPFTLAAGGKFAFVPASVVAVLAWLRLYKTSRAFAVYVVGVVFIPVAGVFTASYLIKPIFVTRTFEWIAPVFLFVVALGLFLPGRMQKLKFVILPVIALMCVGQDIGYYRSNTQDLRGAAQYLASKYQPGDLVMVYPNELQLGLDYYTRDQSVTLNIAALPAAYPAVDMPRPYLQSNKGAPSIIESDRPQIKALLAAHKRIWFVGKLTEPDNNMNVISSELYHALGMPLSSADFVDTPVVLFAKR